MLVDVTYRIQSRNHVKRLRVRFRLPDGTSSVAVFPDPTAFGRAATAAGLEDELKTAFAEDVNITLQLGEQVHYRLALEISADAPQVIGGSEWQPPREFTLSYNGNETQGFVLKAKEWNAPPGEMPTQIEEHMSAPEIKERLAAIGLNLVGVRDLNLPGHASSRRVTEDEIERLFLPFKLDEEEEALEAGINIEL